MTENQLLGLQGFFLLVSVLAWIFSWPGTVQVGAASLVVGIAIGRKVKR